MKLRTSSAVLALVLGLSAFAAPGCDTTRLLQGDPETQTPDDEEWQETEPLSIPDFEMAWERTRATMEAMGYDVDGERTQYARQLMVSRWVTSLGRIRFEGIRRRAFVRFHPTDDGRWTVACAVTRQWNADMNDPMNPASAQWERTKTDTTRAALLLFRVRAGLTDE